MLLLGRNSLPSFLFTVSRLLKYIIAIRSHSIPDIIANPRERCNRFSPKTTNFPCKNTSILSPVFVLYYEGKRRVGQPRAYLQKERAHFARRKRTNTPVVSMSIIDAGVFPGFSAVQGRKKGQRLPVFHAFTRLFERSLYLNWQKN